jgi:hypothetical protein
MVWATVYFRVKGKAVIRTKLAIGLLIVIVGALVVNPASNKNNLERDEIILHRFDRVEIERLNELVKRHQDGKGDYLMLIPPIIDGGYWIYDMHSNGKEITWTIDNTRDGMSSDRGKQVYRCNKNARDNRALRLYTQ